MTVDPEHGTDWEPEDAYDAADPLEARIAVLARIADAVGSDPHTERDVRRRITAIKLAGTIRDEVYDLEDTLARIHEKLGTR